MSFWEKVHCALMEMADKGHAQMAIFKKQSKEKI